VAPCRALPVASGRVLRVLGGRGEGECGGLGKEVGVVGGQAGDHTASCDSNKSSRSSLMED
jgi:hypothetical protein